MTLLCPPPVSLTIPSSRGRTVKSVGVLFMLCTAITASHLMYPFGPVYALQAEPNRDVFLVTERRYPLSGQAVSFSREPHRWKFPVQVVQLPVKRVTALWYSTRNTINHGKQFLKHSGYPCRRPPLPLTLLSCA